MINFLMTLGVVYESDHLGNDRVCELEDEILAKAKEYIRTGKFVQENQEVLALRIIKEVRVKHGLKELPEVLKNILA